jgi:hypothetical protein
MLDEAASSESLSTVPLFEDAHLETMFDRFAPRRRWPDVTGIGIYRREHASIVIQSTTTRLVFDPLCMSHLVPRATTVVPDADVDAILITHSHPDHWHIPSVLAAAGSAATTVLVPSVPKPTVLSRDMAAELEAIGQAHLKPKWNTTVKIGDIEVDVLPFYGEQPAADAGCPDFEVRNWGNCYRVNTPDFCVLVLADSGCDSAGSMLDVVAASVAARGPVDVVMACMRDFLSPFEVGGLDFYWMTLPFGELERLYAAYQSGCLRTTTAGLAAGGIADICAAARARIFVPYAQGFQGIGNEIPAGDWGPSPKLSETQALAELASQLRGSGIATTAQHWNPGDGLVPVDGQLCRVACSPS